MRQVVRLQTQCISPEGPGVGDSFVWGLVQPNPLKSLGQSHVSSSGSVAVPESTNFLQPVLTSDSALGPSIVVGVLNFPTDWPLYNLEAKIPACPTQAVDRVWLGERGESDTITILLSHHLWSMGGVNGLATKVLILGLDSIAIKRLVSTLGGLMVTHGYSAHHLCLHPGERADHLASGVRDQGM